MYRQVAHVRSALASSTPGILRLPKLLLQPGMTRPHPIDPADPSHAEHAARVSVASFSTVAAVSAPKVCGHGEG